MKERHITFSVGEDTVSGLWLAPPNAKALMVLAHGAGAGMTHRFMIAAANGLAERGVATLRYQFPYMAAGRRRPDPPKRAIAAVRAALAEARLLSPDLPVFAGGKSFGGRMTSTAEAERHLDGVAGIVFFGFPLHPPGRPSADRAEHLSSVKVPMLFLQGDRDSLADIDLIKPLCRSLGARLLVVEDGDHSFHVRKSSGRTDQATLEKMLDAAAAWIADIVA